MGLLSSISNFAGDLFGADEIRDASASGREESYKYSREARDDLAPFKNLGVNQINGLQDLMLNPSSITNLPSYQFKLSEGLGAIERSKLAKGKFFSGETARDIIDYAEGLASSTYDTEWLKRFNLVNLGQNSAAQQANASMNLGNTMNQSWQTQGQDVASANSAGINMLAQLGAMAAGGGFGGGPLFSGGGKGMFAGR